MQKNQKLVSAILAEYPSEAACARAMNWPRQRLNKITTGAKEPDVQEVHQLARAVKRPIGEVAEFFLGQKSPNGQPAA